MRDAIIYMILMHIYSSEKKCFSAHPVQFCFVPLLVYFIQITTMIFACPLTCNTMLWVMVRKEGRERVIYELITISNGHRQLPDLTSSCLFIFLMTFRCIKKKLSIHGPFSPWVRTSSVAHQRHFVSCLVNDPAYYLWSSFQSYIFAGIRMDFLQLATQVGQSRWAWDEL